MSNTKLKEEYWKRRQKVRSSLIKWGIKKGLVNDIDSEHSVGVLEKIIKATQKRNPRNTAEYFLKGLNYSRIKHGRPSLSVSLKKTIQPQSPIKLGTRSHQDYFLGV